MRTIRLAAATLPLFLAAHGSAQDSNFGLREEAPGTGSAIQHNIARSAGIPFDKEWHELTPEQQRLIRAEYDGLRPDDEPPYPKGGTQTYFRPLAEAYKRVGAHVGKGEMLLLVYVSSKGEATKVEIYKALDEPRFMSFAASTLMRTAFKPGLCGGQACDMPFVVAVDFGRR